LQLEIEVLTSTLSRDLKLPKVTGAAKYVQAGATQWCTPAR
jgi:hypothetical protein